MVFNGTIAVSGHGEGVVVSTGMNTMVGKIASLIIEDEAPDTPLQRKLRRNRKKTRTCCTCNMFFNIYNRNT